MSRPLFRTHPRYRAAGAGVALPWPAAACLEGMQGIAVGESSGGTPALTCLPSLCQQKCTCLSLEIPMRAVA